ncbi:hypothetical protein VTJ83DRAFT_7000 [Remersonia thermophila]|uniref:Heterokaryon incompatibility domain-containing protein n=1 Tax=Remersonia thermophila TaxID=72144 RepID=A0ABR4D284_9PEZI
MLSSPILEYVENLPKQKRTGNEKKDIWVLQLWIDAICIDQWNATQETTVQIPLMVEIYSRAARVTAWLGADTKDLDTFFSFHDVALPRLQFSMNHLSPRRLSGSPLRCCKEHNPGI